MLENLNFKSCVVLLVFNIRDPEHMNVWKGFYRFLRELQLEEKSKKKQIKTKPNMLLFLKKSLKLFLQETETKWKKTRAHPQPQVSVKMLRKVKKSFSEYEPRKTPTVSLSCYYITHLHENETSFHNWGVITMNNPSNYYSKFKNLIPEIHRSFCPTFFMFYKKM